MNGAHAKLFGPDISRHHGRRPPAGGGGMERQSKSIVLEGSPPADEGRLSSWWERGVAAEPVLPPSGKLNPDTCHGDTYRSWTSSQRTWPGGTDGICGPRSQFTGHKVPDGAGISGYEGRGASVAGSLRACHGTETLAVHPDMQVSILCFSSKSSRGYKI